VSLIIDLIERGLVPDTLTRAGMRKLMRDRLAVEATVPGRNGTSGEAGPNDLFLQSMREHPQVAPVPEKANEQHYEVPAGFYELALGRHLKYSSCYYPEDDITLDQAEGVMLGLTIERAGIKDGHQILELGCGWGSLTLFMAEVFPNASITAVSNSNSQREFIEGRANERGLKNLKVITCDMNEFVETEQGPFDRIVSIEMFEHMRNWEKLLGSCKRWLKPDGRVFLHYFCHKEWAYEFQEEGASNWMGKYFFSGGIMPSEDLAAQFPELFEVDQQWQVNGRHYGLTSEAWLQNMDDKRDEIQALFEEIYSKKEAARWVQRWRMFFMACAELFGYDNGNEWYVAHVLLKPAP
jgi:cyclopropane-fatty-acyl-phospholipid synthase